MIDKFVLDVDGVLNTGHKIYDSRGKAFKVFGPHDKDGLKLIAQYIPSIIFISADSSGWDITSARIVKDWKYKPEQLVLVSEENRKGWFYENCDLGKTAFMGDGYFDAAILKIVKIGICPSSGRPEAKAAADYITPSRAGEGAVLDACLYLIKTIDSSARV